MSLEIEAAEDDEFHNVFDEPSSSFEEVHASKLMKGGGSKDSGSTTTRNRREMVVSCRVVDSSLNHLPTQVAICRRRRKKRGRFANAIKRRANLHRIAIAASQNIVKRASRNSKIKKDEIRLKKERLENIDVQDIVRKIIQRKRDECTSNEDKDPFDFSNDEFYCRKINQTQFFDDRLETFVWHAVPAQDLHINMFPPLSEQRIRNYHRMPLDSSSNNFVSNNLDRYVSVSIQPDRFRHSAFLSSAKDTVSGDCHIILCEFSEQYPIFVAQPGMHSRMKILSSERCLPSKKFQSFSKGEHVYGEMKVIDEHGVSPLIGRLKKNEVLHYFENKLFRAPIYEHRISQGDFLIRATSQGFVISPSIKIYCVGQELPLTIVPSPESKRAAVLAINLLKFYINRLFAESNEAPKHLKMPTLRTIVPNVCESRVRKQLRTCSNFERCKDDDVPGHWILNANFHLLDKEALRVLVTPEDYCAYHSMLSAQYRLKKAGYSNQSNENGDEFNKLLAKGFSDSDDDSLCDEQEGPHVDDELRNNGISKFLAWLIRPDVGKDSPSQDPSDRDVPNKNLKVIRDRRLEARYSREVVADLRKITLESARKMLLDVGITKEEVEKIPRWQVIDVVRKLSTEQHINSALRIGNLNLSKYARLSRSDQSFTEYVSFVESCQKMFELQNRALSKEYADFDCDSEDSADSDIEVLQCEVRPNSDFFQKLRLHSIKQDPDEESFDVLCMKPDRTPSETKLIIYRTYKDENGSEYTNSELVNDHNLAKLYIKIRESFDDSSVRQIICSQAEYKNDLRRAKRRLQDKLRRIKKKEKLASLGIEISRRKKSTAPKNLKPKSEALLRMRCSACSQLGHMKTNKYCPARKKSLGRVEEKSAKKTLIADGNLSTSVHGLKLNVEKRQSNRKRKLKPSITLFSEEVFDTHENLDDESMTENVKGRYPRYDQEIDASNPNLFDELNRTTANSRVDVEQSEKNNIPPNLQSVALNRILSNAVRCLSAKSTRSNTVKFMLAKMKIIEKCNRLTYGTLEEFWTDFDLTLAVTVSRSQSSNFRKNLARAVNEESVERMVRQMENGDHRSIVSEIDDRENTCKSFRDNYIKIEIDTDSDRKV